MYGKGLILFRHQSVTEGINSLTDKNPILLNKKSLTRYIARPSYSIKLRLMCPFGKKIVAFIVDDNKSREIFHPDLTYGFHTQFFEINHLYRLNAVFSQNSCRATDRTQIETSVLLTGIGNGFRTVAFATIIIEPPIDWNRST